MDQELTTGDYPAEKQVKAPEYIRGANAVSSPEYVIRNRWFYYRFDVSRFVQSMLDGFQVFERIKIGRCWMSLSHQKLGGFSYVTSMAGSVSAIWQIPSITVCYQYMDLTKHPTMWLSPGSQTPRFCLDAFLSDKRTKRKILKPGRRILFPMPFRQWYAGTSSSVTPHALSTSALANTFPIRSTKVGWMETGTLLGNEEAFTTGKSPYAGGAGVLRWMSNYVVIYFDIPDLIGQTADAAQNFVFLRNQGCKIKLSGLKLATGGCDPMIPFYSSSDVPFDLLSLANEIPIQTWVGPTVHAAGIPTIEGVPPSPGPGAETFMRVYGPGAGTGILTGAPVTVEPGDQIA